jgi:hypothetical protein
MTRKAKASPTPSFDFIKLRKNWIMLRPLAIRVKIVCRLPAAGL